MKRRNSLILQLTWPTFCGVLAIVVGVCVVFATAFHRAADREVKQYVLENTRNVREQVDMSLQRNLHLLGYAALGTMSLLQDGQADTEKVEGFLAEMAASLPSVDILYVTGLLHWNEPGGFLMTSSGWRPEYGFDARDRDWFVNAVRAGGGEAISQPYLGVNGDELMISVSKLVFDARGLPFAVIGADILLSELYDLLARYVSIPNARSFILDAEGTYITHPEARQVMSGNFLRDFGLQ
ncbi:MAG: cache domain-containing protein, partial [Treponema sp.]|nr:cache domain-containing protein [Treponema sp.]